MNHTLKTLSLFAVLGITGAHAAQVTCYTDEATNQATCIQETAVTANGSVRASPLFTGGPRGVEKTSYFIVTDCAKQITTLQDRRGVNFAGSVSGATNASSSLARWMCEVNKPRQDKTLKQFSR